MIKINLLPFRAERTKENIRRQISLFLLLLILSLLILVWFHLNLNGQVRNVEVGIQSTKLELKRYTKINNQIIELRKRQDILQRKTDIILALETNRYELVRLLDKMTQAIIPQRMWFEKLTFKADKVGIKGIALDEKTIVEFMKRLEKTTLFRKVNLMTLEEKLFEKSLKLKKFQIDCVTILLNRSSENQADTR